MFSKGIDLKFMVVFNMISKSPERNSFQKEGYLKRCEEEGKEPNQAYLDMYQKIIEDADKKWLDPKSKENNLEWDLVTTDWILEKVRTNDAYAQNLYAAMCNNDFTKREMWPILKEEKWSCSWRYAGGIIADMQQKGDYIDWYCSGMGGLNQEYDAKETNAQWQKRTGYVPESVVTDEIEGDLNRLGWIVVKYDDTKDI
jgi:hypothetical protein